MENNNCPYCDYHLKAFTKTHDWDDRKYHLKCWKVISKDPMIKSLDLMINCTHDNTKEIHIQTKRRLIDKLCELQRSTLRVCRKGSC
jgi:hypothetical protein